MPRRKTEAKHILKLTDVSAKNVINLHYGDTTTLLKIDEDENSDTVQNVPKVQCVTIEDAKGITEVDILHENDKVGNRSLFFFDSKKRKVKLWPVMIDVTQNGGLPLYTNKPCRNCHHGFSTHPIGCPIRYNANVTDSNDEKCKRVIKFLEDHNLPSNTNDFFETEGMFCSWPCVKAYIFSCLSRNPHSHRYKNALSYMTLMFKKINGTKGVPDVIPSAGPINTIDVYGGHLTIDEYRASFGVLKYDETINIRRPYMFSCSQYIEEIKVKV